MAFQFGSRIFHSTPSDRVNGFWTCQGLERWQLVNIQFSQCSVINNKLTDHYVCVLSLTQAEESLTFWHTSHKRRRDGKRKGEVRLLAMPSESAGTRNGEAVGRMTLLIMPKQFTRHKGCYDNKYKLPIIYGHSPTNAASALAFESELRYWTIRIASIRSVELFIKNNI